MYGGPYKYIGKETWPCCKNVKRQRTIIILAIFVDLPSPMICAKIQIYGILGFEEEDFEIFSPYMGMAVIFVNGPQPF